MKFTEKDIDAAIDLYKMSAAKRKRMAEETGRPELGEAYVPLTRKQIHTLLKRTADLRPDLTTEEVIRRASTQGVWGPFTENAARKWSDTAMKKGIHVSYSSLMLGDPETLRRLGFNEDMQINDNTIAAEILYNRYHELRNAGMKAEEANRIISSEFFGSP